MAKQKKGHVIRVSDYAWSLIAERRNSQISAREAVDLMISEYEHFADELGRILSGPTYYAVLSEGIMRETLEDARGAAVLASVRRKKKKIEEPVVVKVIE